MGPKLIILFTKAGGILDRPAEDDRVEEDEDATGGVQADEHRRDVLLGILVVDVHQESEDPRRWPEAKIIFARIKLTLYWSLIIEGPVADLNPCRRDKRSMLDHLIRHRISLPEVKLVVLANRDFSKACPACMR